MTTQNFTLTGYQTVDRIYSGTRTQVYRALRTSDKQPVAIKVLHSQYPNFSELLQFRNQYTIAKNLNIPGIVRPYSLEAYGNSYALMMEDFGGISMQQYAQAHSLSALEVVAIALQLTETLHDLHQNHVIHKDIKPDNILIHPDTKEIKLIDFSIASLLPKETQEIKNPSGLEGTLAYLAPEQTGRMNRGIDYRTDFYALGVTLFELLTGQLPFQSTDPMELVHCHLAKTPPTVASLKPEMPQVVSAIVNKLMAKNAEDRYQSALGLQHDLQTCLTQLNETGEIVAFEIGQRDVSDRFTIPEKLYGRETEVQALLNTFDRVANGTSELMLVAGFSGIGKTAVVNEVHKPIVRQRGYFIKGKFDQFNRNIPFSAFVQAFRDLMGQLLSENDNQLQTWKAQILVALGENGQVIIEVIPELERIIGLQPPAPELSGTAAQNRFNLLLQKFIHVFTTPNHPLVMFLDDLQWADSASLNLIEVLMAESVTGHLLLLGAYRDNEVFAAHPLMLTLDTVSKAGATVNTITLQPLSQNSLNHLVADTLHCAEEVAQPLSELVMQKTQGNPFFATQFLKALHQERLITFDSNAGYWQCDIVQVRDAALTDDVVEFMALQLQKLPEATQNVLKLAACFGNQFDLTTLAIVLEQSETEVAIDLWKALQEGLILPQSEIYKFYIEQETQDLGQDSQIALYRFLHDRVQQAAYSLSRSEEKSIIHLRIAEAIQTSQSSSGLDDMIFDVVNHYNQADLDNLEDEKAWQVVDLNIRAGKKAKFATAFDAAITYFNKAIVQIFNLDAQAWENHYELVFDLHIYLVKTYIACACWHETEQKNKLIYEKSRNLLDRSISLELLIEQSTQRGEFAKAIDQGREALSLLDEEIPEADIEQKLETLIAEIRQQERRIVELKEGRTKTLEDKRLQRILAILSILDPPIFIMRPILWKYINARSTQITLVHGTAPQSPAGLARFGQVLCGRLDGSYTEGFTLGQIAMELSASNPEQKCLVCFEMGLAINHWVKPVRENIDLLRLGFQVALESGLMLYAGYNLMFEPYYHHYAGQQLEENIPTTEEYLRFSNRTQNGIASILLEGISIHLQRLQAKIDYNTWQHQSKEFVEKAEAINNVLALQMHQITLGQIYFLFEDFDAAIGIFRNLSNLQHTLQGYFSLVEYEFYYSLSQLQQLQRNTQTGNCLTQIDAVQDRLAIWQIQNPENCKHKYDLIEAERCRVIGRRMDAIDLYDRAITSAKANNFIQDEALANELAAKFYLNWGKEKVAAGYMQEAYYCYARWGAKAKTEDLEQCYPQLLAPILQQANQPLNVLETLASITTSTHSTRSTRSQSFTTSLNTTFDFAAILKASQALSSTIQLDDLLHQLTQIILQNFGGDRCALILPNATGEWQVEAIATPEATELCAEPLDSNTNVPVKLIQYVKNTQAVVVVDNGKTDLPVLDQYLSQQQPKSVLCLPILSQTKLIGLLYLENQSTSGVFTSDRILILNFLCTQAAISLENARLYHQVQQSLTDLQQAQLQIIQSEKMSALGNLVAGVAHEINNPIGCIVGNVGAAQDYINDLLNIIDLYNDKFPQPGAEIEDELEEIDLDYVREDLPKLIRAMKDGGDRIKSISKSLRTFSRADTDHPQKFDLHDGIESTVLILRHRLKANEQRPEIEVATDYGKIPPIECFPGQLNQVFMNIMANAIDALDESTQGRSYQDIQANPNRIIISTSIQDNYVKISIADNGKGMPEEVKAKIFDHLFTTKGVGKGTGLGLAIARQIIVEKHGGAIDCNSSLGKGTEFVIHIPVR